MKFTRKIRCKGYERDTEIILRVNTRYLTRDESIERFDTVLDEIVKALMTIYSISDIKIK